MKNTFEIPVSPSDKIGDRILIGKFSGAVCFHVEILQKTGPETCPHATVKRVKPLSVKNSDGTFLSLWVDESLEIG